LPGCQCRRRLCTWGRKRPSFQLSWTRSGVKAVITTVDHFDQYLAEKNGDFSENLSCISAKICVKIDKFWRKYVQNRKITYTYYAVLCWLHKWSELRLRYWSETKMNYLQRSKPFPNTRVESSKRLRPFTEKNALAQLSYVG
jgi:hypothetical protein